MVPEVETLWMVPARAMGRLMTHQVHRMTVGCRRCGREDRGQRRIVLRVGIDSDGPVGWGRPLTGGKRCGPREKSADR